MSNSRRSKFLTPLKSIISSIVMGGALMSGASAAYANTPVEHRDGVIAYAARCESSYLFSFFDGQSLQRLCLAPDSTIPIGKIVQLSRSTDCFGYLRVVSGNSRDGTLWADEVEPIYACASGKNREEP